MQRFRITITGEFEAETLEQAIELSEYAQIEITNDGIVEDREEYIYPEDAKTTIEQVETRD